MAQDTDAPGPRGIWGSIFARKSGREHNGEKSASSRWTMGILEDKETIEVPGMQLIAKAPSRT
jgi:hypothetical protein